MSSPQHLHLQGLQGSAFDFLLAAVHSHEILSQTNHLIILRDAEEAAYFQNTVENNYLK
jgi:transcription-repair coupling factor (superfamily II helicase)